MSLLPKTLFILVLLFTFFTKTKGNVRVDPLVNSNVGLIRGLRATDGDYSMFLGIPYAYVNETNTFGLSIPYPNFEREFEAFDDSSRCPYTESNNIYGSLDCLRLNVHVPNSASSINRLPVLVWIHGGNFETGTAGRQFYDPKFLVRRDVIVVTVNHRIGLYGYMCLNIPEVPGNQGLKDQVLAMRWVNNNINAFGGDVNRITLFGESSGGRSVDFHIISPQEKLFNSAILQSGTSLTRDTIYNPDTEAPFKLAERLGYSTASVYQALEFLSTVEPQLTVAAAADLELVIKPCVEQEFDNVEQLITDYTINLQIPKVRNMPILIGYNNDEQIARYADRNLEFFDNLNIIHDRLRDYFDFGEERLNEMERLVHRFYLGDEVISYENMREIVDFDSVFSYVHSVERSIKMYLDNEAQNIFYYVFSYVGGRNYFKIDRNVTVGGASHADELGYLFDMDVLKENPAPEDQLIIDRITTLWANFAKFGNPTPDVSELLPVKWEPVTRDTYYYYDINTDLSLKTRPFHNQTAFWDLFYNTNWSYQKGYKEIGGNQ